MKRSHIDIDHNYSVCNDKRRSTSYGRDTKKWMTTIDEINKLVENKEDIIPWLQDIRVITNKYDCPKCQSPMILIKSTAAHTSSDEMIWSCRKVIDGIKWKEV